MHTERSTRGSSRCVQDQMGMVWTACITLGQTVSDPLKEGHHFDQSLGGVAGMFENIRSNTQVCRYSLMIMWD